MIVFDLRCGQAHVFEAWFGSSGDFESQLARGLLACPICDDKAIEKAVMAPAVGAKGNQLRGDAKRKADLRALALMQAEVEASCDDVGDRFAEEARRRFATPAASPAATARPPAQQPPPRGLMGETTVETALELLGEGIPVLPLPFRRRRKADA